ncbi:MAG: cardiolipin synthase B, partial [Coxiellaceae bacterium]|nr:cardiolipin synthase B [Coxiellaceae bacterium]
ELETFIFDKDHLGDRIVDALEKTAARGVHVRILVDGAGSPLWTTNYAKRLEKAGAKTRVFHPFPWQLWNWSRSVVKLPWMIKLIYLLLKSNSRNHRKVCIIDDTHAYVGSVNISKCHLSKKEGGDDWRDTAVRLSGANLNPLIDAFNAAWTHRGIKERLRELFLRMRHEQLIHLNHSRHRRRILHKRLLRRINNCKHRIWITNAYFVPDTFLLRRLKEAAKKGVDVRILLPKKSDVLMMPWASSTFYYSLLKAGVRIFEYLPSMLHAKSLIIDGWASLGSTNLNHRSLLHDLEADVNLTQPQSKELLEKLFLEDLQLSHEVDLDTWHRIRPLRQRFLGRIVLYLKYWI